MSNVSFSDLSTDLGRTMYEFKFRIPPYYTLLVRTLSVLEVGSPQPDNEILWCHCIAEAVNHTLCSPARKW